MNTNLVVVALCSLSLGATVWLVASQSQQRTADDRVAELEKKLDVAEKRADAAESLRAEVREMKERLDRRLADAEPRAASTRAASTSSTMRGEARNDAATPPADAKPIEELVAERVEKKIAEKMDAMAARDKERGDDGKWKAPFDELSAELKLTDAQKPQVKKIFDSVRDDAFVLLKTQRLDGGCLLDDYAAALKQGGDFAESTKQLYGRLVAEKVPGTDRTYFAEFVGINQDCEERLGRSLDKDQMKRLKSLRVDLLDVRTGYDPVGDYVRAKVQ